MTSTDDTLDLFAGPGGWDEGVKALGFAPLGVEYDDAACATRAAAGHRTLQGDVAALDPAQFAPCGLLIGSPPCPTFSTAGDQQGHLLVDLIVETARALAAGEDQRDVARLAAFRLLLPSAKSEARARRDAAMSILVVEPLRYALALRPTHIALEQVPPVLPIWRFIASLLEQHGYRTWCGILNAADYGVPQTRRRAFLLAHLDCPVHPPEPTHCKGGAMTIDGELLPWVSMAEALGWTGIITTRGERDEATGGNEFSAQDPSWAVTGRARSRTARADEPSATIVGTRRSKDGMISGRQLPPGEGENVGGWGWNEPKALEERQAHGVRREPHEPAPTITAAADNGNFRWVQRSGQSVAGEDRAEREADEPSVTITGRADLNLFVQRERSGERSMDNAIRITLQEAAILQGFRPDYPWQGSRTKQFEQVGNAVCPPLALAVIQALLDG